MNNKLIWLIDNYQKVVGPSVIVNSDTKIKGTTLEKLSLGGPPYERIASWIKSKLKENINCGDMEEAAILFTKCYQLMKARNEKYGDSWKVLTIPAVANLIEMKMHRIANMDVKELDPKIEDEFIDAVNYGIFGLLKINIKEGEES